MPQGAVMARLIRQHAPGDGVTPANACTVPGLAAENRHTKGVEHGLAARANPNCESTWLDKGAKGIATGNGHRADRQPSAGQIVWGLPLWAP